MAMDTRKNSSQTSAEIVQQERNVVTMLICLDIQSNNVSILYDTIRPKSSFYLGSLIYQKLELRKKKILRCAFTS